MRRIIPLGLLILLGLVYGIATLPHLDRFPVLDPAQNGIMAPARKLAQTGVYGNDLYKGLYNVENRNYEYLPLHPLSVALMFRLFGFGIWQARFVSVISGLITILLTYWLGKQFYGVEVGLGGAALLTLLPLAVAGNEVGALYPGRIPLLDVARVIRYDMMTVMWVMAAALAFGVAVSPATPKPNRYFFLAGFLAGLATLSHLYGAFILIWFGVLLLYGKFRPPTYYWLIAGWLLPLLPWGLYIVRDLPAFQGQMLRHEARFSVFDLAFYFDNLWREPWRYLKYVGAFRTPILFPRPGLWVLVVGFVTANGYYAKTIRSHTFAERALWLSVPILAGSLALLVSFKRYPYTLLVLPFVVLQAAYGLTLLFHWSRHHRPNLAGVLIIFVMAGLAEGLFAIRENLQTARRTPTLEEVATPVKPLIPPTARILMLHTYWPPFAGYDVRALDLVFNLSDPHFFANPEPIPTLLAEMAPDFVLVSEENLKAYVRAPGSFPSEAVRARWQTFDHYLQAHCVTIQRGNSTPDYGTLLLLRCPHEHP